MKQYVRQREIKCFRIPQTTKKIKLEHCFF
nr:MAG TPA: hypothetical protein [Caudoviricetes sp.]